MKPFRQRLADYLEVEGWDVELVPPGDLGWWADEIWHLSSSWSPIGAVAFISFLVDPRHEGPRSPGSSVWAAGVCQKMPRDREEARKHGVVRVRCSKNELEAFLEQLEALRVTR